MCRPLCISLLQKNNSIFDIPLTNIIRALCPLSFQSFCFWVTESAFSHRFNHTVAEMRTAARFSAEVVPERKIDDLKPGLESVFVEVFGTEAHR